MAIYVFNLLIGYTPSGVDYAQGVRAQYLKRLSVPVKYVYTDVVMEYFVQYYQQAGIDRADMLSAHQFMCGNGMLGDSDHITDKAFYCNDNLVIREYYTDHLLYTDYYTVIEENGVKVSKLVKRTFRNQDATVAYDILYGKNWEERYVFPDGEFLSKQEFLCKFIQKLNLTEDDIVLIDRPGSMDFVQPIFLYGNGAKIITFLHSGHYAEPGEMPAFLYLNYEYFYWFKCSGYIHTMLVSTEEQKRELIDKLKEYGCPVPNVVAIPIGGLEKLHYPNVERKSYSLLTVSRLISSKQIDWAIRSVIEAHKVIPEISLDIYGKGDDNESAKLLNLVQSHHAEGYIRFMGHQDVRETYVEYEAYITTSAWETLGLSVMEAVGSGNAVIGLDVKYGNKLFIQNEKNGYLIEYDYTQKDSKSYIDGVIQKIAEGIIELFSDTKRLETYRENSYEIAADYVNEVVGEQWVRFFNDLISKER